MYTIEIADSQDCLVVDEQLLREVVEQTLTAEGVAFAEISVALVDNRTIHELNKQYLNHDFATDVLSFSFAAQDERHETLERGIVSTESVERPNSRPVSGEVIVSTEMAAQTAQEYGWPAEHELLLYLVHGLLHLCGYDDRSDALRQVMRMREKSILSAWDLEPRYAALDTFCPE